MTTSRQTASHWGVYNVVVDASGAIETSTPHARDANPGAFHAALPELVRSPLRIDKPYVRESFLRERGKSRDRRGRDAFVELSWTAALALVKDEILRVKDSFGNEAIYGGSYGWASAGRLHHSPSVLKRFLGLNGGYVDKLGNHSFGAALHIAPYVIGRSDISKLSMAWPLIVANTRLIVMFGGAHLKNSQIDSGGTVLHEARDWFGKAKAAGVEIVNVGPSREDVAEHLRSDWLPLRPNTDVALMLGLAHTLIVEGLHDLEFLTRYCEGFPPFEDYVLGRNDQLPKSAEWASSITGLPAAAIEKLARKMAATRTLITTSWSVQRGDHGEQPIWMTIALASLLGQIGLPGGGFTFGLAATSGVGIVPLKGLPRPTLPLGPNAVKNHVPVGRITDVLLHPGRELEYNGRTIKLPDIRMIYSAGGNPFHHNTNLNRFMEAWRRPEVVIVHEPWWNPAAKNADIVLPATTTLERNDIQASEFSRFYAAMRKVVDPVGQSRNDFDIFSELAEGLGFGAAYTEGRNEMDWLRHMYETSREKAQDLGYTMPDFDEFWSTGLCEFPEPSNPEPLLQSFRLDPEHSRLNTPSGKIELYSKTIAGFGYPDCPPHPAWLEPAEWLGSPKSARFPIHLLSNQPAVRLHSQLDPSSMSRNAKIQNREPLKMNPADAGKRGLKAGDIVRVFNDRGAFVSAVSISDSLLEGVAQIATGAWFDPQTPDCGALEKHGNPNVVTDDKGTSRLGQSSVAQTVLVEIERLEDAPPVTAFDVPVRLPRG
jgi:biotin/methionine sulfoxide reductase